MNSLRQIAALACVMVVLVSGCKNGNYQEQIAEILKDSRYSREIKKNGYLIRANYLPMKYFELRHLSMLGDTATSEEKEKAVAEAQSMYKNGVYFMVTIGYEDNKRDIMNEQIANFSAWSDNLQKFYFGMKEYINLSTEQDDDIKLSVYDFQNTFGYTKDRKMLLCFPKEFNDREILSEDSKFIRMNFKEWGWGIGKQSTEWDISDLL